jgi:hypothetical protein
MHLPVCGIRHRVLYCRAHELLFFLTVAVATAAACVGSSSVHCFFSHSQQILLFKRVHIYIVSIFASTSSTKRPETLYHSSKQKRSDIWYRIVTLS